MGARPAGWCFEQTTTTLGRTTLLFLDLDVADRAEHDFQVDRRTYCRTEAER